jgi:hypothetical protein
MLASLLEGPIVGLLNQKGAMEFRVDDLGNPSPGIQLPVMDSAGTGCSSQCTMGCTSSCGMSRSTCCR